MNTTLCYRRVHTHEALLQVIKSINKKISIISELLLLYEKWHHRGRYSNIYKQGLETHENFTESNTIRFLDSKTLITNSNSHLLIIMLQVAASMSPLQPRVDVADLAVFSRAMEMPTVRCFQSINKNVFLVLTRDFTCS